MATFRSLPSRHSRSRQDWQGECKNRSGITSHGYHKFPSDQPGLCESSMITVSTKTSRTGAVPCPFADIIVKFSFICKNNPKFLSLFHVFLLFLPCLFDCAHCALSIRHTYCNKRLPAFCPCRPNLANSCDQR